MVAAIALVLAVQSAPNTLTPAESRAGWRLLFDGKTTNGWTNYKSNSIRAGWQVKDGILTCTNPDNAGDIVTTETFDWFDLTLEFNLAPGGNSGVVFRATEEGQAMWQSGPEIQLYDHPMEEGVETTGFLYMLYGSKVDAQKPAGEWNTLRILVSPTRCMTVVNYVVYHEYVYGSEDFWARVKKSKFSAYPYFAKAERGMIGLQGDHGVVSFRNIKIRPISPTHGQTINSSAAAPKHWWRGISG
jgi:hypothetical protein